MSLVSGFASPPFGHLVELFGQTLASGADLGAAFAATIDGEMVVDLWGGWADPERTRPWARDTLVNVYSTTKTMTALTALLLADRGALRFDAPVAAYWPEFAAAGKAAIEVRHLMSHAAGLPCWRERVTIEDIYDWEKATGLLAEQAPYWPAGAAAGYHGLTQGFLVGEVVRRITGRTLGAVFRDEIAGPLAADFHIGLPEAEDYRVADLMPPPPAADSAATELMLEMAANPPVDPMQTRTRAWRAAEIPAAGGHGTARSIAQIHAILANGGAAGKPLLSEPGRRKALEPQIEGVDLVLGVPVRYGLGFGLPPAMIATPHADTLYWGGMGGSLALVDLEARMSFAYVMNRMENGPMGDPRAMRLIRAMWRTLGF